MVLPPPLTAHGPQGGLAETDSPLLWTWGTGGNEAHLTCLKIYLKALK